MSAQQYKQQYRGQHIHEFCCTSVSQNRLTMLMEQYQQQQHWGQYTPKFWQTFKQALQSLWQRKNHLSQLAAQRQALLEMDEHILKDIGISRSEAVRMAKEL